MPVKRAKSVTMRYTQLPTKLLREIIVINDSGKVTMEKDKRKIFMARRLHTLQAWQTILTRPEDRKQILTG